MQSAEVKMRRGREENTYLLRNLGLLASLGFLYTNDLSLLHHAATSEEAGQQQSNFMDVLW